MSSIEFLKSRDDLENQVTVIKSLVATSTDSDFKALKVCFVLLFFLL